MMPLDTGLYNSFSYCGPAGFARGGATPMVSVTGLQRVSNNMWQPPGLTSSPVMGALNAEQSTEIFNLAVECQALSTEQAKQFQTLSGLEAMHHAVAQATANKTIHMGWMAQNVAYGILLGDQTHDEKHEETLQQLHIKANQTRKDTNDLVFNHQLCYDGQLMQIELSRRSGMRSGGMSTGLQMWQVYHHHLSRPHSSDSQQASHHPNRPLLLHANLHDAGPQS